ncbi:MAG: nucleic acid-binding protein, partial [Candidatus Bathyarchaeia archaeon]
EKSIKLGEKLVLSEADLEILALAFDLKLKGESPVIVSDDYSIQNMAESLGLKYSSLATFGISHKFEWILYCPACFKKYPQSYSSKVCAICGTALKRKVLRKKSLKR